MGHVFSAQRMMLTLKHLKVYVRKRKEKGEKKGRTCKVNKAHSSQYVRPQEDYFLSRKDLGNGDLILEQCFILSHSLHLFVGQKRSHSDLSFLSCLFLPFLLKLWEISFKNHLREAGINLSISR